MNIWLVADTHFGHKRMKEFCDRPEGYEYTILRYVREYVKPDDILIHLGDVSFGEHDFWLEKFMDACAGKKWLLKGNHDDHSLSWFMERGWDFAANEIGIDLFNKRILFSHVPLFDLDRFDINIHGHHHNNTYHEDVHRVTQKHVLIAMEHEYRPVNLQKVILKWQEQGGGDGVKGRAKHKQQGR